MGFKKFIKGMGKGISETLERISEENRKREEFEQYMELALDTMDARNQAMIEHFVLCNNVGCTEHAYASIGSAKAGCAIGRKLDLALQKAIEAYNDCVREDPGLANRLETKLAVKKANKLRIV